MVTEIPYVGPRPFDEIDQKRFFGRQVEIDQIVSLIYSQPQLLIYSASGAGKTSLMNAGLIPQLRQDGLEVLPVARVRPRETNTGLQVDSGYMLEALLSIDSSRPPESLCMESLRSFLEKRPRPSSGKWRALRILFIDQFEEILTPRSERYQDEQESFFQQVKDALEADPQLRIVFLVREDNLAQLETFAPLLPEGLGVRYRLEQLSREAALDAVVRPTAGTGRGYGPGVAEELVDQLLLTRAEVSPGKTGWVSGRYVEPVQLQVVCESLWRRTRGDITSEQLKQWGDVKQVLAAHYDTAVHRVREQCGFDEWQLREWIESRLITPMRTRGTVFRDREYTDEQIPNAVVDVLQDEHLLRGEPRAAGVWYELVHDTFIEPVLQANRAWFEARRWRTPLGVRVALPLLVVALIGAVWFYGRGSANGTGELASLPWLLVTQTGRVTTGGEAPSYPLNITTGKVLVIHLEASEQLQAEVQVLAPNGSKLDVNDLDSGPGVAAVVAVPDPGRYELHISGANDTTGPFQLVAGEALQQVGVGGILSRGNAPQSPFDVFALQYGSNSQTQSDNDRVLKISSTAPSSNVEIWVLSTNGSIERQLTSVENGAITVLKPGLYYLVVNRYGANNYRMQLSMPPSIPLPIGGKGINAKLQGGSRDQDTYTMDGETGSVQVSEPSGGRIRVLFIGATGEAVVDEVLEPSDISGLERPTYDPSSVIVVENLSPGAVTYRIRAVKE